MIMFIGHGLARTMREHQPATRHMRCDEAELLDSCQSIVQIVLAKSCVAALAVLRGSDLRSHDW
jgi:hypothetical protein